MSAKHFIEAAKQLKVDQTKPWLLTRLKAIHMNIINQYKCKYEALLIIYNLYFTSSKPWKHLDAFTIALNNMTRLDDDLVVKLTEAHDRDVSLCEQKIDELFTRIKSEKARLDGLLDSLEVRNDIDTGKLLLKHDDGDTTMKLQQKDDELAKCKELIKLMRKYMCDDDFITMCCADE